MLVNTKMSFQGTFWENISKLFYFNVTRWLPVITRPHLGRKTVTNCPPTQMIFLRFKVCKLKKPKTKKGSMSDYFKILHLTNSGDNTSLPRSRFQGIKASGPVDIFISSVPLNVNWTFRSVGKLYTKILVLSTELIK